MKAHKYTFILVVIFIAAGSVQAAGDWDIYSDAMIEEGDDYWTVRVFDSPPDHTTVDMTGGSANGIQAYDASILNISGGSAEVTALEQSIVNISGGHVQTLAALNISTVNVSGGTLYSLSAYDNSIINFSDSANSFTIGTGDSGTVYMFGGTTEYLRAGGASVIYLHNGIISDYLSAWDTSLVNLFGYNFHYDPFGGNKNGGQITGFWLDDTAFLIDLYDTETYNHINYVPEPTSILFFGLGTLLIKRRR